MAPTLFGRPLLWVNVFWVSGLLIDTGCRKTVPDLLAALGREGLRVDQVVNTHVDEDHIAGNAALQRRFGVVPRVHRLGVERLARPEGFAEMPFYRRLFWGVAEPSQGSELGDEVVAGPYRFQVLHTPGHAPEHVALWEAREGWLFSGDLMLSPRLNRVRTPEEPALALESLRMLAALPVRRLFCGHAGRVAENAEPLKRKVAYWEHLQQEGAALRARGLPLPAVTRRLLGKAGFTEWLTRGDVSKHNLMSGLLRGGR